MVSISLSFGFLETTDEGGFVTREYARRLDAAGLWYEVGREVQAVALVMRRHELVDEQQVCACGRLPVHLLPSFGLRCDVAGERWVRACEAMRRVVAESQTRAVGRATVVRPGYGD